MTVSCHVVWKSVELMRQMEPSPVAPGALGGRGGPAAPVTAQAVPAPAPAVLAPAPPVAPYATGRGPLSPFYPAGSVYSIIVHCLLIYLFIYLLDKG